MIYIEVEASKELPPENNKEEIFIEVEGQGWGKFKGVANYTWKGFGEHGKGTIEPEAVTWLKPITPDELVEVQRLKKELIRLHKQQLDVQWEVEADEAGLSKEDQEYITNSADEIFKQVKEDEEYLKGLQSELTAANKRISELEDALNKIQAMKLNEGETDYKYAFNRCWHIATDELAQQALNK